ncbi:hypothetical protein [Nannocystis sp.]|uniref:hypothetical protein n=1 Tax=Nannocystis sp. TaxID=1962667 RepID=UPI0025E3713F|nr:hypothetical protein [Nannocystis sp.]
MSRVVVETDQPSAAHSPAKLSTKKLKYLKKPRIPRLLAKLTSSQRRRCAGPLCSIAWAQR